MRLRLAFWCVKMRAVEKANHLLTLLVLPDEHLHVRRATSCISAVLVSFSFYLMSQIYASILFYFFAHFVFFLQ